MSTVNTNIMISATARQATAVLNKVQGQLKALGLASKTANAEQSLAARAAAAQIEAAEAKKASAAAKATVAIERDNLKRIKAEQAASLAAQKSAASIALSQQKAAAAAEVSSAKQATAAARAAAAQEAASLRQSAALQRVTAGILGQVAKQESANAKTIASNNKAAVSAVATANKEAAAREQSALSNLRAVASHEVANARRIASDARVALQAQITANIESGNANKVITARLREAAVVSQANLMKLRADNAAGVAAAVKATKESAAAREVAMARTNEASAASTAAAKKSESDATAAAGSARGAVTEIESQIKSAAARNRGAIDAALANERKIVSDTTAANAAAMTASKITTAEMTAARAATVGAQEKVIADAKANASRLQSVAAATSEAAKKATAEAQAAAAAAKTATAVQAARQKEIASNTAATASNRSWAASMTAAGSRAQWVGRQLMTNLTMPVLLFAGAGVKWGLDMEKSMTRLNKVYGDSELKQAELRAGYKFTAKETKALERNFVALSEIYGVQSDEVANVAADWAAAGSSGAALAKQTDLTMRTMVLGEMDAEEATKSLVAIQAQWGAVTSNNVDKLVAQGKAVNGVKEDHLSLEGILRQLNAVENETGTSMNDLVVAFSRSSGVARQAGFDTAHLAAAVAALVPAAGSASEAGTALKSMINKMMTPTNEASEIFAKMGINMDAAWHSMNGVDKLEYMSKKFQELTQDQKAQVSASVATRWQINKFMVLMEALQGPQSYYNKALRELADADNVVAIAQKELNEVLQSSPQRAKQAGVIIQNSLMKAMEPLIPVIIQLALWIGKLFKAFGDISPSIRTMIVAVLLAGAVLGPLLVSMAVMKLSLGVLAPLFMLLGKAMISPILMAVRMIVLFGVGIVKSLKIAAIAMRIFGLSIVLATSTATAAVGMFRAMFVALGAITVAGGFVVTRAYWATMVALLAAQRGFQGLHITIMAAGYAFWLGLQAAWSAASLAITRAWAAATTTLTVGGHAATKIAMFIGYGSLLILQKAYHAASTLLTMAFWKKTWAIFIAGNKGVFKIMLTSGKMLLRLLASPWVLAITAVVAVIAMFQKQIGAAVSNVVNYFKNLPSGVYQAFSPVINFFGKAKDKIISAFNALPAGVRNALLAVVRIVAAAARKVYELFSYINPFARHSPSLVENVTNGMAVVNAQFANTAKQAQKQIGKMHGSIKTLQSLTAPVKTANEASDRQELGDNAAKVGAPAAAMPQYDKMNAEVKQAKVYLDAMNKSIEAQDAKLKRIKAGVDSYDNAIEKLNSELATTQAIQDQVNTALTAAQARYERFSNAQIKGTQAAEDAAFDNEMAQKRLQLQIAKMEEESGTIDSVTDSYSKLQGEIETLTAKQTELRNAGAGSDILGTYDKMIADLKKQQGGLMTGGEDSPAGKIAALNTQLQNLQKQAEIMDLEKSLKFDSLNRNIEKFKNNVEELPYGQIMSGMDASRTSVNALQYSYDQLGYVMDGQNAKIAQMQTLRDNLQKTYDLENTKLDSMKTAQEAVEEAIRASEQAMEDFSSAIQTAISKQEALENATKNKKKKKGKGGSDSDSQSPGANNFDSAAAGDYDTVGGNFGVGREGVLGDQSGDIDKITKDLQGQLESSLGGLNPFAPLKVWWGKTVDWFNGIKDPLGDFFGGIGRSIAGGFGADTKESSVRDLMEQFKSGEISIRKYEQGLKDLGVTEDYVRKLNTKDSVKQLSDQFNSGEISINKYKDGLKKLGVNETQVPALTKSISLFRQVWDNIWSKIGGPVKTAFDFISKIVRMIVGLFGPDLMTTIKEVGKGFVRIWDQIKDPLMDLFNQIKPVFVLIGIAIGNFVAQLEIVWEVVNGAIGPVFDWLGGIIRAVVQIITGVVRVISGVVNIVFGVIQTIIGVIKGIFTGDWGTAIAGLKRLFVDGFGRIFKGIWNIVQGIWTAIWSTIKNFAKLIWNVVWGFVKGIIDFFTHLWDVLVGHSIVPDMIKAIIMWFLSLPGKILMFLATFIWNVIKFFLMLPIKIIGALVDLAPKIWDGLKAGWNWLVANLPQLLLGLLTFFGGIPAKIIALLIQFGPKLWEWMKTAWNWVVDNLPQILLGLLAFFGGIPVKIITLLIGFGPKLWEWMKAAWNWIVDNGPKLLIAIGSFFGGIPAKLIALLIEFGPKLWDWMKKAFDGLVDKAPAILKTIGDWLWGIPKWILNKLGLPGDMLVQYGKDMIQGLYNGAKSLLSKIGEFFLDMLPGWIKAPFKKALGIESPSKVFYGYGENIGEGLVNGVNDMAPQVEAASNAMAAAADTGPIDGPTISASADTSSVGGAVTAMNAATAAAGAVDASVAVGASADIGPVLDAVETDFDTFSAEMLVKVTAFRIEVALQFGGLASDIGASFASISTMGTSQFTLMQSTIVGIVTALVTAVIAQLKALISYVNTFGPSFTAAWIAVWASWQNATTVGVDHTLSEWERMAKGLQDTVDTGIKPVFEGLDEMLENMEKSFSDTAENVGTTWKTVEDKTKDPARVVINDVYNDGIRGAWNKFNEFLGVKPLDEYKAKFATGGPVWGAGNGTSDSVDAKLSRGEHIITAKEVQGAGGHKAIMAQRALWAGGNKVSAGSASGHLASGGSVQLGNVSGAGMTTPIQHAMWDAVRTAFPNVVLNSATRTQDVGSGYDYHMQGMALDLGGPMDEIARWIYQMNKKTPVLELIHWPLAGWQNLNNGAPLDYGAGTNADHVDHVHWAMNTMVTNDGKLISMAGASRGGPSVDYRKLVEEQFKTDMDGVRKKLPKIDGKIGEWPKTAADVTQKMALKYLLPLADKATKQYSSSPTGNIPWNHSAGVEQWRKLAIQMLLMQGEPASYVDQLLMQMESESRGDPNAINLDDENARRGTPSKGLMQVIDPTFQANRDPRLPNNIWDPAANIAASIRYTRGRYGSISHWSGVGYDSGGVLPPGMTLAHNQTGGPEAILTNAQWNAMFKIASSEPLTEANVEDAVIGANNATGNTANQQADAIIKGMDVWQQAWTPEVYEATNAATDASNAMTDAANQSSGATVLLSKSLGKYDTQIKELSKVLTAFSNSASQSVKVTVNVQTGEVNKTDSKVTKNSKGETIVTVEQPTFSAWTPTINAVADLIDALPYQERDWAADNPVAGETEKERKARIAQNNMTNYTKGIFNVTKDVAPVVLRHTAIIGAAVEKLVQEDAAGWAAVTTMGGPQNPATWLIMLPLILKELATLLPLILAAILDIVPALIRAIVRFLTQFMPDSVYAYADMAAAEAAVTEQQGGGDVAMGQGQRYPTDAMSTSSGNAPITMNMYGDLVMPNVSDGSDAGDFVDQLRLLASN